MGRKFKIKSPVDGQTFAKRKYAKGKEIESVLEKSQSAFHTWSKDSIEERSNYCLKAVEYFQKNIEDISREITLMMGRPIRYSPLEIRGGFKERAEYMVNAAVDSLMDRMIPQKDGFRRFIRREPLGVILVLAPWNYPYLTSVNAIIPALMAGNTVVLKHADQTAVCSERYMEAFKYAGLPDGVFQYLHMDHDQVAQVIADKRITYTAFTGSVKGGKAIQRAVGSRFISTGLELGGKDPAYVSEDVELGQAIENLVDGSFFNSGQSCCGIERIYVHKKHFDEFVEGFLNLTLQYTLGDPTDPETTLGPLVRKRNAKKVLKHIEDAVKDGAKELIDPNEFPKMDLPYLAPQVLVNVNHQMEVMLEETFGPVVGIMSVSGDDEAIQLMNDSVYGLTASIWTNDVDKAIYIGDQVETGTWFMNRCDYLDPELAWTGVKSSGKGVTLSSLGYDYLTRPKSFHLKL